MTIEGSKKKSASPIMAALESFEATEANLAKLERLEKELCELLPSGVSFGSDPEYEDRCRSYAQLLAALPEIDGWRPSAQPPDLNELAHCRLDALEAGEPDAQIMVETSLDGPARELREYRFRLNTKRRTLIRDALVELMREVEDDLRNLRTAAGDLEETDKLDPDLWADLKAHVDQIEVLLGSSVQKPPRWRELRRHIHFGYVGDLNDIERVDWQSVRVGLRKGMYGENEPLPVGVGDLSELVASKP
ncbi:MAG: hypothetical protein MI784_03855, partial [Cytophagales bacterium]|nr:hypothetical protein [Cytophagales bacterium]